MNDNELRRLLEAYRLPRVASEYWERFPARVAEIAQGEKPTRTGLDRSVFSIRLIWQIALPAAGLLLAVLLFPKAAKPLARSVTPATYLLEYMRGVEKEFPNQVSAIVFDATGPRLMLADKPNVPDSTALLLKVCDGGHCERIITFSGQDIELDGQKFSVMTSPEGKMIVFGENLLWSEKAHRYPNSRWSIEAYSLGSIDGKG